ncbi:MAG TPA: hypothetical protein VJV74_17140, partial [Terriglobia bacterium]|nr:hypothetical protein [Terriglobia bacterium]
MSIKAEQRESEAQESGLPVSTSESAAPEPDSAAAHPSVGLETEDAAVFCPRPRTKIAVWIVILVTAFGSVYFFYTRGFSNLYGDGIAHMEGARRLWDSLTPGYSEIGSVWLPLYHILASPLALNDTLWRTGLAGSIVSA